jgi:hypothetical protein
MKEIPMLRSHPARLLALIAPTVVLMGAGTAQAAAQDEIARGGYLVRGMGCADCHMPLKIGPKGPEPDLARGLSGHPQGVALPPPPAAQGPWIWGGAATNTAFYGPWGTSFAANLTPDAATGIGSWTAENFVSAMKLGKHAGSGRPIAPPMPWQALSTLTEQDLRAMFAYLKSQPAVNNAVPPYQGPK